VATPVVRRAVEAEQRACHNINRISSAAAGKAPSAREASPRAQRAALRWLRARQGRGDLGRLSSRRAPPRWRAALESCRAPDLGSVRRIGAASFPHPTSRNVSRAGEALPDGLRRSLRRPSHTCLAVAAWLLRLSGSERWHFKREVGDCVCLFAPLLLPPPRLFWASVELVPR